MARKPRTTPRTAGEVARAAILGGATNGEALRAARKAFPTTRLTWDTINWHRQRLIASGADVMTARQLKRARQLTETGR